MYELYIIPEWFFSFSVAMEILFSIVTLAVAISGILVYRIIKERSVWRFSLGFLMISISYAAWAAINSHIASEISNGVLLFSFVNPSLMRIMGIYTYIIFFIAGLVTLAFVTLRTEKGEFYYLTLGLALTAIVASVSKFITFRIVSLFLITFIAYYYFNEWYNNKNRKTCWTFLAFLLLVISNIFFIFMTSSATAYIAGHLMELGAYTILLVGLINAYRRR